MKHAELLPVFHHANGGLRRVEGLIVLARRHPDKRQGRKIWRGLTRMRREYKAIIEGIKKTMEVLADER